jgi:predicted site-specific integrase-resolvase
MTAWAPARKIPVDKIVAEVGSTLDGHRRKFLTLLCHPSVRGLVVEHRDRFCRLGWEYVQAALAAQGRELVVVDVAEIDNDLVDMTEMLTSMCARLFGKRAAGNRARRALVAAAATEQRRGVA